MSETVVTGCRRTRGKTCLPTFLVACITVASWVSVPQVVASDDVSDPWSVNDRIPVIDERVVSVPQMSTVAGVDAVGAIFCYGWLRFYQEYMPAITQSRCPMTPSCSRFCQQAIRKHGPFWGITMTADRLMRESSETRISPLVWVNGRFLCYDPVESNDFWWEER